MAYTDSLLNQVMSRGCEGYGFVVCFCGGDLCVCGLDGEACPGCDECEWNEADYQQEVDRMEEECIQEARSRMAQSLDCSHSNYDYWDDSEYWLNDSDEDERLDELEEWLGGRCGYSEEFGGCSQSGSEECELECPLRDGLNSLSRKQGELEED